MRVSAQAQQERQAFIPMQKTSQQTDGSLDTIVIASHNTHKLPEIIAALGLPPERFVSLGQLGIDEEADESASSFAGNAWIKAGFAFARTKSSCLADDSGLEVDALGGEPGVRSARYAGESASDAANVEKLLGAMRDLPDGQRRARFVCEIAFIAADGSQLSARGSCEGYIARAPKGENGFGYDPVFIPDDPGDGRSLAELTAAEKNRVSHRGQALRELARKLEALGWMPAVDADEASEPAIPAESLPTMPKTRLAVYDFDGTLLKGASPVKFVRRLLIRRILPIRVGFKVLAWGMRYKLRLPVKQELVRGFIFRGLSMLPTEEVDSLMVDLYHQELRPLLRQRGLADVVRAKADGKTIGLVSASFRPIIQELAQDIDAEFFVCTEMEVEAGSYTGKVVTSPPEGVQKLLQMRRKADSLYGEGGWILDSAFGDHHSDIQILSAALYPSVVKPDKRLANLADQLGWPVCDWK